MNYFLDPLESILNHIPLINKINLNIDKVSDFLNVKEEANVDTKFINGTIVFKNVSYSYNDCENIIRNFNARIDYKDRVEIKGPSGCGKSTICKILNQSIDSYQGNITINNVNLRDYSVKTIRKNILYVSQREKLFTDTIKNNIVLDYEINDKELAKVAHLTFIDEIIDKKGLRFDSMIFDSGLNLSGGERQRIILARSIIRKPKVLILDEALSEIDKSKSIKILKGISEYLKDSTIIYISHSNYDVFDKKIYLKGLKNDKVINA